MITDRKAFSRYFPVEPLQKIWGLHVLDCGHTTIEPGMNYPPGSHPKDYAMSWETGRTLSEFQLVYITEGQGVFESESAGSREIKPGTVFLLFPDEWHRYRPESDIGWKENWIGFSGEYASDIMSALFSREEPLIDIGYDNELLNLIRTVSDSIDDPFPGYKEMISGYTIAALSRLRKYVLGGNEKSTAHNDKMEKARAYILEHVTEEIDLQKLSAELGMSYSSFRITFKQETGQSPRQYQLITRVNKAKEMLAQNRLSLSEIADQLGFCSIYYFSRIFKEKTGVSPSKFRKNE